MNRSHSLLVFILTISSLLAGGKRKPIIMPTKASPERDVYITSVLDSPLSEDKSTIWCATFQLAWDEGVKLFKQPISMNNQHHSVDILNKNPIKAGPINPKFYYANAGWLKDGFYNQAMKDLKQKFRKDFQSIFPEPTKPNTKIISLSHLECYLPFLTAFKKINYPKPFIDEKGQKKSVKWFGYTRKNAEDYVCSGSLLRWKSESNFILQLTTRVKGEKVILGKMERPINLKSAINSVYLEKKERKPSFRQKKVDGKRHYEYFTLAHRIRC